MDNPTKDVINYFIVYFRRNFYCGSGWRLRNSLEYKPSIYVIESTYYY